MESIINNQECNSGKPPCLMIRKGEELVILVHGLDDKGALKGTVVHTTPSGSYYIGYYSSCWNSDRFLPFEGSVTLSNR